MQTQTQRQSQSQSQAPTHRDRHRETETETETGTGTGTGTEASVMGGSVYSCARDVKDLAVLHHVAVAHQRDAAAPTVVCGTVQEEES